MKSYIFVNPQLAWLYVTGVHNLFCRARLFLNGCRRHVEVLFAVSFWDSVAPRPATKDPDVEKTFGQYIMKTRSTPLSCEWEHRSSTIFP